MIDYIDILNKIREFLIARVDTSSVAYDVTIGRYEPQPDEYPFIKVDYPIKVDEVGKYGLMVEAHIDINFPIVICANQSHINDSRDQCWEILALVEDTIRGDVKLGNIEHLSRGVCGGAEGVDMEGKEYRLTLTLDCRFQYHKQEGS